MSSKSSKDYFGLPFIVSLILAIIPVTAWILGIITRLSEKKIVAAIVRILFGWNIIWLLDLIFVILNGKITRLINM